MSRISDSKDFITTFFNRSFFRGKDIFVRENGLIGFPNVDKSHFKKEMMIYSLKKVRLKKLLNIFFHVHNRSDFIFFKGYDIEKYYPKEVFRVYTDIDLLCKKDIFDSLNLPEDDFSKLFVDKDINIEIKYNFFDPYYFYYLRKKQKVLLKEIYKDIDKEISNEYNIILLSIHNFQHQFSRLDRFFDIYYILLRGLDLKKVMDIANKYKVDFFLRYNLILMETLGFPINLKKEYLSLTELEKRLLIGLFNNNKSRYKLFLLMLKLDPIKSVLLFFEKVLFLDSYYIKHIRKRRIL